MKKRFLLFVTLSFFVLFFCFNVEVLAVETTDPYYFFEVSSSDTTLLKNLCPLNGTCKLFCNPYKNGKPLGEQYTTQGKSSLDDSTEEIDAVTNPCGGVSGVKKFYLSNLSSKDKFSSLVSALKKNNCGTSKIKRNCYEYVRDVYCSTHSSSQICNDIVINKGTPSNNESGKLSCKIPVEIWNNTKTAKVSLSLYAEFDNNKASFYKNNIIADENGDITMPSFGESFSQDGSTFYMFNKGDSNGDKFSSAYYDEWDTTKKCPVVSFCSDENNNKIYYAEIGSSCPSGKGYGIFQQTIDDGSNSGFQFSGSATDYAHGIIGDKTSILDCDTLLSGDGGSDGIIKILKIIVNITKFLVPIILVVMGSIDFIQAIFAQSEDGMKKAQAKFIKRVIIAIIIFLIPSILKAILTIANGIWPAISSDFCGIL